MWRLTRQIFRHNLAFKASAVKRRLIIAGVVSLLCIAAFGLSLVSGGPRLNSKARKEWKEKAIKEISQQTSDTAGVRNEIESLKVKGPQAHECLIDSSFRRLPVVFVWLGIRHDAIHEFIEARFRSSSRSPAPRRLWQGTPKTDSQFRSKGRIRPERSNCRR